MATVTYIGPERRAAFGGFTFYNGEAREVPDMIAGEINGHPWFTVEAMPVEPVVKRHKRGRNDAE